MCILFISKQGTGNADVCPIDSDAELLQLAFQDKDTVSRETCRNQRALKRDGQKVALCSSVTIKHSVRGEYWYADPSNKTHCKKCTARVDRGGWRGERIDEIQESDRQASVLGNGDDGTCKSEHQMTHEKHEQGQLDSTDQYNFPHRTTSSSPPTKLSSGNMTMGSVNPPRRDQSTRNHRPKPRPKSLPTSQATTIKRANKATTQREGGRRAPIEVADSPEPQPKSERTPKEDALSRFIVDDDDVSHGETAEHRSQSSDLQLSISEQSFLDDLPADVDIEDDRSIAQKLRRRTGNPTNYRHCYQESIRKNHVYSNGKLVPWDEGDTDNEDGDLEQSEVVVFNDEGEDFVGVDDTWGVEVNEGPFTANPGDIDDANIRPEAAHQNKERLPRISTTRKQNNALSIPQVHHAHARRTQVDRHTTNAAAPESEADPRFLVERGLSFLEGPAGDLELHPTSTQPLRAGNTSSSANTTRKRTRAPSQEDLNTILLTNERPTIHNRNKVTATAAKLRRQVIPCPRLQTSSTLATHTDIESGLPTPSKSSASAPASILDSTALIRPRYQKEPDIDDDTTNNTATILRLRQQLADLTAQLAVERAENTDLQTAFDGMARRCARLIREVDELKVREGKRS